MTNVSVEMPQYQCHKKVWALKIDRFDQGGLLIIPEDKRYAPIPISYDWSKKHEPKAGGYYVVYPDGYASYSPPQQFEEGFTLIGSKREPVIVREFTAMNWFNVGGRRVAEVNAISANETLYHLSGQAVKIDGTPYRVVDAEKWRKSSVCYAHDQWALMVETVA